MIHRSCQRRSPHCSGDGGDAHRIACGVRLDYSPCNAGVTEFAETRLKWTKRA